MLFEAIQRISSVCIEIECPYKCCIDNNACNTRDDCMLEDNQYCTLSSDCLSGCCHGRLCHPASDCSDYQLITGLVLGLFYLLLICCGMSYIYSIYKAQKTKKNIITTRKIASIYQGFMAKNLAKALPMVMKEGGNDEKKLNLLGINNEKRISGNKLGNVSPDEKCNLNMNDEEKPNTFLNQSPPIKKTPLF